ncbi:NADH:ubiquinone oxidoreductase 24 kD subunit [Sphaerochaeta pleomorpha str. Grapes]|uniref:NADH:ubiquinone oxidoreductase 24 kD subunit n=2 Tax=Sphaerochaeta TaxID=399320 RepID=G8QR27_SPHPG|nr:NADH:ubiquinone oxidoreductase 24 kD subunit [Sphaerochaeta pleomorpha str. Grapes]
MGFVMEKVKVELCMGSSCFARGNSQALANLESYISENHLEDRVELIGHLCLGACSSGPNMKIDDISFSGVRSECVVDLLIDALNRKDNS